jgi:enamine deaminase RidA (YjgF/YER057c/UK114 family)
MGRARVRARTAFEPVVGYSRAVRDDRHIFVAGTGPTMPEGGEPPADAYGQAKRSFQIVLDAMEELGASAEHVVRTRAYLVRAEDWEEVGRAHGEAFGTAMPATAFIVVAALLDPRWLVEVEADAMLPEDSAPAS